MFSRLQYISQGNTREEQLQNITNALEAGCKWIQLRFKEASNEDLLWVACAAQVECARSGATFIINDNVELAKTINADGVHLGLDDMPVAEARRILGNKIIGGTANTLDHVLQRVQEKADYVGLGPLRFTATKKKLSPELGFNGYAEISRELNNRGVSIPVYAIGGVVSDDIPSLLQAGCHGIAISGAITNAADKKEYVTVLKSLLHGQVENSR